MESLLSELSLTKVADVPVGNHLQKFISGGERKRTAIGINMVTDPSLLILDEPTSALDSFNALKIVKMLKRYAR